MRWSDDDEVVVGVALVEGRPRNRAPLGLKPNFSQINFWIEHSLDNMHISVLKAK
jgi:hypothetical protein